MVLCIDAGNSNIKIAVVTGRRIRRHASVPTAGIVDRPERFARYITKLGGLSGAAISSVVPELNEYLKKAIRDELATDALLINAKCRFPFLIAVKAPGSVGVDRLCAAAGLDQRTSSAVIVDVGSAITVDLLREGAFKGGLIMPGPGLGLRALGEYARKLPEIDYKGIHKHFPQDFNDTRSSMILGAHLGAVGAVREAVRFLTKATRGHTARGRTATVFTGGGAGAFVGRWPVGWRYDPDLVLRGVYRIWVANRR